MKMNELSELENMLDTIFPEEDPPLTDKYATDFIESLLQLMTSYIENNPKAVSEPDFHEDFKEDIEEIVYLQFEHELQFNETLEEDIDVMIEEAFELFFITIMPPRSFSTALIVSEPDKDFVEKTLVYLRSKPQPAQRTDEWYKFRHNLITASNAYKAFENQSSKNQLIYEKCQPMKGSHNLDVEEVKQITMVNVNTTLHWGQKYEPLSVLIYEYLYETKIEDFGCIQHDHYSFLGASPDGINVDPNSERFGRMLEIKNIVNREIDGIPKKEYWIQTQLQMEVCNLNECDFLETQFKEYENYVDYFNDININTNANSSSTSFKGFIMYFSGKEGKPLYKYKPLEMKKEKDIEQWEEDMIHACEKEGYTWIKNIYWRLECMSCVLILRNKLWFSLNVGEIEKVWNIILLERETGYQHRGPNKRIKKESETESETIKKCLINIDESGKTNVIQKKDKIEHFFNLSKTS